MNDTGKRVSETSDPKVLLSTLWIFVTVNYLYCDVMTLMDPTLLKQIISGFAGGFQISQGFLMGAAVLMEIPMGMILLSRVLKYSVNRWTNILSGFVMTVVQIATLFTGTPTSYYLFFSVVEIACNLLIVWYAWKWRGPETIVTAAKVERGMPS